MVKLEDLFEGVHLRCTRRYHGCFSVDDIAVVVNDVDKGLCVMCNDRHDPVLHKLRELGGEIVGFFDLAEGPW